MKANEKSKKSIEVSQHIYELIQLLCKAIKERRLLYFYFESETKGKIWRKIRPYMVLLRNIKGKFDPEEILEIVGLPIEELKKTKRQPEHYFLYKLDMKQFEILDETFDDPGVPRKIVVKTESPVVCRFVYDDENLKEVMKSWIRVSKK